MHSSIEERPHEIAGLALRVAPRRALIYLFAAILFLEGLYLPLLFRFGVGASVVAMLLYLKYAIAAGLALGFGVQVVRRRLHLRKFEIFGLAATVVLGIGSLVHFMRGGPDPASSYTVYIFPTLLYFAGRALRTRGGQIPRILARITRFWSLLAIYALVDILLFGPEFWRDFLRQGAYLFEVKGYAGGVIDGLIGNFYYDPYALRLRRAVGTQGDPLAFAYASVVPLATLIFLPGAFGRLRLPLLVTGLLALLMSLTRAVVLSLVVVLCIRWMFKRSFSVWALACAFSASVVLLVGGARLFEVALEAFGRIDSSTRGHLETFDRILEVPWLHFAVGSTWVSTAPLHNFEPAVFNIATNFGAFAALLFYVFLIRMLWRLNLDCGPTGTVLAVAGATGGITSLVFSESFFSFTGFGLFWLLAGVALSAGTTAPKAA